MSSLAIFNDFKPANLLRNRYLRKEWAVMDANLHHGDIRPFACPEEVCDAAIEDGEIFPMKDCCCLTLPNCTEDPVKGFCKDQYFWIDNTTETLRQSTAEEMCLLESCRAGSPVPERPTATGACVGDDYEDEYLACIEAIRATCDELKQAAEAAYDIMIECNDRCPDPDNPDDPDPTDDTPPCDDQRKAWQAALAAYKDCLRCLDYSPCEMQAAPCDAVTMHYVITYKTMHAGLVVESAPSLSVFAMTNGNEPNVLVNLPPEPADYCIVGVCIYRVTSEFQDGTTGMPIDGSEFVMVGEVPAGTTTFNDTLNTSETGYPLTTSHPMNNPAPTGVKYLARTEDGIAVATDNMVFISIGGQPQFGLGGVVSVEHTIKAIRAIGNTIFVLTDCYPILIKYQLTDGIMSIDRNTIPRELPLKSKKSVSLFGSRLYFASTFSLYMWDTGGYGADIRNPIQQVMTPDQWKMVDPGSVVGTAYEYGYLLHSRRLKYSLMIEIEGHGSDTQLGTSVMPITYVCMDSVARDKDGHIWYKNCGKIYKWDWRRDVCETDIFEPGRTPMCETCCPFTIRLYHDNEGKNTFKVARLEWDNTTASHIMVTVYEGYFGTHTDIGQYRVKNSRGFGICGYASAQTHWVEITGCGVVSEFRMATSYSDLVRTIRQDLV